MFNKKFVLLATVLISCNDFDSGLESEVLSSSSITFSHEQWKCQKNGNSERWSCRVNSNFSAEKVKIRSTCGSVGVDFRGSYAGEFGYRGEISSSGNTAEEADCSTTGYCSTIFVDGGNPVASGCNDGNSFTLDVTPIKLKTQTTQGGSITLVHHPRAQHGTGLNISLQRVCHDHGGGAAKLERTNSWVLSCGGINIASGSSHQNLHQYCEEKGEDNSIRNDYKGAFLSDDITSYDIRGNLNNLKFTNINNKIIVCRKK